MSAVQVLLQTEGLKIARALPEASTLTGELLAFKVSISLKGHDSYLTETTLDSGERTRTTTLCLPLH